MTPPRQADWTPEVFNLATEDARTEPEKFPEPEALRCTKTLELFPLDEPAK